MFANAWNVYGRLTNTMNCTRLHTSVLGKLWNFSSSPTNYDMIAAGAINQSGWEYAIYLWTSANEPVNENLFDQTERLIRARICQSISKLIRTPSGDFRQARKFREYLTDHASLNGMIIENRRTQSSWSSIRAAS